MAIVAPPDYTEQALARAQIEVYELQRERMWENRLFANAHVSAAFKLTLRAVWMTLPHGPNDWPEFVEVPLWRIAQFTGLSTFTVGRNIKQLVELHVIDREDKPDEEARKNGLHRTQVFLKLLELAEYPEDIRPVGPDKNGHGGTRCKVCGSEAVYVERRVICAHCQAQQGDTVVLPLNTDSPDWNNVSAPEPEKPSEGGAGNLPPPIYSAPVSVVDEKPVSQPVVRPESESIHAGAQALALVLGSYHIEYKPGVRHRCGCELWYKCLGEWACARCEPGNLWPDKYIQALRALYPLKT